MGKIFLVDMALCNGCYGCQVVCKDEHCDNEWLPYAAKQPQTGQFWCRVDQKDRGKVPVVKVQYTPHFDGQNDKIAEYAPEAVTVREDGIIVLEPEKVKGRKDIADKFEGVYWNEELEIPQACTGCAHLLDNGWDVPRCVDACATGALRFGDEEDFGGELENAIQLAEGSHTYYLHYPKQFVYGCFVDRPANEVVIGADVELRDADGAIVASQKTDEFGEFRFTDVEARPYEVVIKAEGYKEETLDADASSEDVVLGDIFASAE